MDKKIKVSIFGATGYTGIELYRRLKVRDDIEIIDLPSKSSPGKKYSEVVGTTFNLSDEILVDWKPEETVRKSDVVFTALPHGETFDIAKACKNYGKKLIDIGADYRLEKDGYANWYGLEHRQSDLIDEAVYCIPELHRDKLIEGTWLVSNPGCYPTSFQLGLAPLIEAGIVETKNIIVDSKSGVSGAGRGLKLVTLYSEQNENVNAYGVGTHRHKPEMERHLQQYTDDKVKIMFTPHLMPMTRGIHSTIYTTLKKGLSEDEIRQVLIDKYKDEYFVKVLDKGVMPHTKWVYGSNFCHINVVLDEDTGNLVILSAIDNLVKGASGQAIQNMNILFGIDEKKGIENYPIFP